MSLSYGPKFKTIVIIFLFCVFVGSLPAARCQKKKSTKTLRSMARAYVAFGKYDKAHKLAVRAMRQGRSEEVNDSEMALCLIDLGTVCSYKGLLNEACKYLKAGIELQKSGLTEDHPYVAQALRMLCDVHLRQGQLNLAEDALSEAIGIMLKHNDLESKEMAPFIFESANLQFEKGQFDRSQENFQAALDMYNRFYGQQHLMTANVLEKMSRLYTAQGDLEKAGDLMAQCLTIKTRVYGRYHIRLVDSWLSMAQILKQQGHDERCEYYLAKSTETVSTTRNAVVMARVYEQVNQIRKQGLVAAAIY